LAEYDEFRLVQEDYMLVGARSGRTFRMGDRVRIKVVAANLTKRQLDYEWVLSTTEEPAEINVVEKRTKRRRKKSK
ncbi:MAG: ribonuclease R, partial [Bacteroidota bacterium]|nr:ribonuclease R [Bacteroidota bacterium]